MYCIKCGVELSDNEKKCPLCSTTVYHPDIQRKAAEGKYPPYKKTEEVVTRSGVNFILSVVSFIIMVIALLCDFQLNKSITWSGYVINSVALLYVFFVLPLWFHKPNPVIFAPIDFACTALYLYAICYFTSGEWFVPFALPLVGYMALISTTVIALVRYVKRGYLYIIGSAFIASGTLAILIEYLINQTIYHRLRFIWSVYPMVTFFLIGIALFVIAMSKPLRESLHRRFFV